MKEILSIKSYCFYSTIALLFLVLTGCASIATKTGIQSTLYFGLSSPKGEITEKQWDDFLKEHITPAFPEGFTVINGYGQWKNGSGEIIREKSKVLIILHNNSPEIDAKINEIRTAYKSQFKQESVILVTNPVDVSF